jgi:hypothetical protein
VRTVTTALLGAFLFAASGCHAGSSPPRPLLAAEQPPSIASPAVSSGPSAARAVPIAVVSASDDEPGVGKHGAPCSAHLSSKETKGALAKLGRETLRAIEARNMDALARLVHPTKGLALGTFGRISHTIGAAEIRTVARDGTARSWDGPSNMADHPIEETYEEFLDELAGQAYSKADTVGYGEVVQEDALCGADCVAKDIATAFPCAPFIQYDYPTGSPHNPGMWHFLVIAFEPDAAGWHVIGFLRNEWSP